MSIVDEVDLGSLPMLPSTGQPLEHSAARDRIQLKNRKHTASQLKVKRSIERNSRRSFFVSFSSKINEQEEDHCSSLPVSQPNQHSIVKVNVE